MSKATQTVSAPKTDASKTNLLTAAAKKTAAAAEHLGVYIDPLSDFGFKRLFGDKELMIDFLSVAYSADVQGHQQAVLRKTDHRVRGTAALQKEGKRVEDQRRTVGVRAQVPAEIGKNANNHSQRNIRETVSDGPNRHNDQKTAKRLL